MRVRATLALLITAAAVSACGSSSTPSPSAPSVTGGGAGGSTAAIQVYILGRDGASSFRPSPVNAPRGSSMVWINSDTEPHRIVAVDGSFDTGELQPDAQSGPVELSTDGARYYCPLHEGETGSINAANGAPPPCSGDHCG
jgi:plastocyanin